MLAILNLEKRENSVRKNALMAMILLQMLSIIGSVFQLVLMELLD